MAISVTCDGCAKTFKVQDDWAGRTGKCPACGAKIKVPTPSLELEELAPAPDPPAGPPPGAGAAPPSRPLPPPVRSSVPPPPPIGAAAAYTVSCPKCGQENIENSLKCIRCDSVLHDPARAHYGATDDGTLGGLIPYKNAQALLAYYLGVFSLIPCIGSPLGLGALVLGILGLKFAKLHPEAKGTAHAWTGIILGGLCGLAYTVLLIIVIIGIMSAR